MRRVCRSERGRSALYIGSVYMPTDSTSIADVESCYGGLKEDLEKRVLGRFDARVVRSVEDDVIGIFGEDTCSASGNRLGSPLNEIEMVVCSCRKLVLQPEWTRLRPSLRQRSIIL